MTNHSSHSLHTHMSHAEQMRRVLHQYGIQMSQGAELMHLVRMTAQTYDAILATKIREGRLSPPRLRLLLCLFAHEARDSGAVNPTHLSRELKLSKNTISSHLRALEDAGYVIRDLDPDDLRQFQIRLADCGRKLLLDATPQHMTHMDALAQGLDPQEIEQLQRLLGKLLTSLHVYGCRELHPVSD